MKTPQSVLPVALICLSIVGVSAAAEVDAAARQLTKIAAQELAPALHILARERDVQVVYRSELVIDHRTGGANGNLTLDEALAQLLAGTGLTYIYLAERAITIVQIPAAGQSLSQSNREGVSAPVRAAAEEDQ